MTPKNIRISRRQFLKRTAIAAAALSVVPEAIVSARPIRIDDTGPNWYVDSVHGADTNDGKSLKTAFATIGKLLSQSIQAGQTIGLVAGSHWREMLRVDVPKITISAYGNGLQPILDASDVIPPAGWTKTPDKPTLFQATVSPHFDETTVWVNVWEEGKCLPRAADVNQCATTPGTCFVSSDSAAPVTIYVHPADNSNPASNRKVYEFSARLYGIDLYNSDYSTMQDIQTQKNLHNNGSTALGRWGTAINCTFLEGSKHNVYGRTGVNFVNCVARNQFYNDFSTLFVYNEAYPQSEGVTYINCTASNDVYNDKSIGFLGHSVNGVFGDIHYANCTVINCGVGFQDNAALTISYDNCRIENADTAWTLYMSGRPYSINGCTLKTCHIVISTWNDGVVLTASDLEVCGNNTPPDAGMIVISTNQCNLSFDKCIFDNATPGSIFQATGSGPLTLNVKNSQFINATSNYNLPKAQLTLVSDTNCFQGTGTFIIGGNTYPTLSAFQASGQDTHSTAGNCSGCA